MNKAELIDRMAVVANISKADASRALDALLDTVAHELAEDHIVTLIGFGSFRKSKRAARKGRNPQTGAEIHISARNTAVFSAGKALKDALNK